MFFAPNNPHSSVFLSHFQSLRVSPLFLSVSIDELSFPCLLLTHRSLPSVECASRLKKLQVVQFAHNKVAENCKQSIPEFLTSLPQLVFLDVRHNKIKGLPPPAMWKSECLRTLLASDNDIGSFDLGSDAGRAWPVITGLYLSNNRLKAIPTGIEQLCESLVALDVNSNKRISELPLAFGKLRKLRTFPRGNLPNLRLPSALLNATPERITSHLHAIDVQANAVQLYRMRMLIVGLANQGKTAVLRHLINADFPAKNVATTGIDIREWPFKKDGCSCRVTCWDFAGQEVSARLFKNFHRELVK